MAKKPTDQLLDHIYDGIQEYDNPLPPWWVYLFIITIIWGIVYLIHYDITGMGPGSAQEYQNEVTEFNKLKTTFSGNSSGPILEKNDFALTSDVNIINSGKQIYLINCVSCHGVNAEGGVGPNLTDDYWIHGGEFENVIKTIFNGVMEKGMLAWKTSLNKKEIYSVANYVYSLNGTNPANAKAPQGNLYKRQ